MTMKLLTAAAIVVAGAGAVHAADIPTTNITALDICDTLGINGLTLGSSDTCLQVSGFVKYEFRWGDYANQRHADNFRGGAINFLEPAGAHTHSSLADWWLQFQATSETDFGNAQAVLRFDDQGANGVQVQRAYVRVGDQTVLTAGLNTTIFDTGDSRVFNNFLGLFSGTGTGGPGTGGARHVIQLSHEFNENFTLSGALEDLANNPTAIAVAEFSGGPAWGGHVSFAIDESGAWKQHSAAEFRFDNGGLSTMIASDDTGFWNAMISGEYGFDMFTLSGGVQYAEGGGFDPQWGAGAQITAEISDDVTLNLGSRYLTNTVTNEEIWQVALGAETAIADNLDLRGRVGYVSSTYATSTGDFGYFDVRLRYQPGARVIAATTFEANTHGAYRVSFDLERRF